jgi:hypothetical protein
MLPRQQSAGEAEPASPTVEGGICSRVFRKGSEVRTSGQGPGHPCMVTGRESGSEVIENGSKLLLE